MKLKKIHLSGFKSFVDPTTIELQSNLTGVVGPNGCGKSNIIDAVRWVMGEISAKQLRGESMSDVIFNGSSTRKSVGQAAVELIFDNSDASLGGEYAKYQEISVRREVTRDGGSDYYLNNSSCRRKDITDIFLGTGLGVRSYAIIEQGMISELIEAKPDELRIMIEEAAGISKYKERRRETENRIKHTRENLSRLSDIREELEKQLKHLHSQANAAERYKKLKQEERLTKAQLHTIHFQDLTKKLSAQEELIKNNELQLENKITESYALDAKNAELREAHAAATENFNDAQSNFYRVGATIARLEQQIKHTQERHDALTKDLVQIEQSLLETKSHQITDKNQITTLNTDKLNLEESLIQNKLIVASVQQELQQAEQKMQEWQTEWDQFNNATSQVLQRIEVEQTHAKHSEQIIAQETRMLEKFTVELSSLDFAALTTSAAELTSKFEELKANHETLHSSLAEKQQQIAAQRADNSKLATELDQARSKLQVLIGRRSSLEALQQTALGKNDHILVDWLKRHDLDQKPRLAQELKVVPGWETAVETVLGNYLEAVCVDNIEHVITSINTLTHGNLVLFDRNLSNQNFTASKATLLSSKISANFPINLPQSVYAVESNSEALALRPGLGAHESVVTKDGLWLGASWLRVTYNTNQKTGILQRESELQELNTTIVIEQNNCATLENALTNKQRVLLLLETEYHELQQQLKAFTEEYSTVQSQASTKQAHLNHLHKREQELHQEIKIHEKNLQDEKERLNIAQLSLAEAANKKNIADAAKNSLLQKHENLNLQLKTIRENATREQQNFNTITMRSQLVQSQIDFLVQNLARAEQQVTNLNNRKNTAESALREVLLPLPALEADLQKELEHRLNTQATLDATQQKVIHHENELRSLEQKNNSERKFIDELRILLEKLRTEREGMQVRATTYREQLAELEMQLENVMSTITDDITIETLENKLTNLATKIERLGLINLAAIEEFEKLQERKTYLDAQNQDLVNAMEALEAAIHKIDGETKERFKETYDNVNQKFQELFPKIFNGGRAYLEQTENDLLNTGVLIMAQPPGKRNASIHLLSGGEKALTATALIFSIFQLNPAPFCMLDEVDAPLDDVNVSRFCNLVKDISQTIQFIFVTHNKLTMEIANQLIGITMREAGVSRTVTVDIDSAVQLAAKKS